MAMSRRNFLQVGAVAAVVAGTPLSLSAFASSDKNQKWVSSKGIPLMSKATFDSLLNTSFEILPERKQKVRVELVAVQDTRRSEQKRTSRADNECFSLAFRSSSHPRLKQETYRLRHNKLGDFDLFIGPVKSEKYGMIYEAIINHVMS
jgi:Domain of unknown function (DUF6916)